MIVMSSKYEVELISIEDKNVLMRKYGERFEVLPEITFILILARNRSTNSHAFLVHESNLNVT